MCYEAKRTYIEVASNVEAIWAKRSTPDLLESLDCGAATDMTGVLNPVGAKPLLLLEYFP